MMERKAVDEDTAVTEVECGNSAADMPAVRESLEHGWLGRLVDDAAGLDHPGPAPHGVVPESSARPALDDWEDDPDSDDDDDGPMILAW